MKKKPNAIKNAKYARIVRRLRQRIFTYEGDKADRILKRAIALEVSSRPAPEIDQWGATAEDRRQLARHGIAWGD